MKHVAALFAVTLLAACTQIPVGTYTEPVRGHAMAKLRIVTNGAVYGNGYTGCMPPHAPLAVAGRTVNGAPNPAYLPVPLPAKKLEVMPERLEPPMPVRWDGTLASNGPYTETVAEYLVPADTQFLLESAAIDAVDVTSVGASCKAEQRVYQFEEDETYEAVVGTVTLIGHDDKPYLACEFTVYPLNTTGAVYRQNKIPLTYSAPVKKGCQAH